MRKTLGLFWAVLYKEFILLKRYPVNTFGYIVGMYALFLVVFFGGRAVAGQRFDDSIGAVIIGYFLVVMAITAYQDLSGKFTREAQWGTLEQLFMSPLGFGRVSVMLAVANVLMTFFFGGIILVLMLATTRTPLQVDLLSVIPIVVLTIMSVLGVGFVFGGAAVRYKRISALFSLLQFGFLGLVAAPVQQYPVLKFLPLSQGSYLLGRVMEDGARIWELPADELAILAGVGVAYFAVGYLVFGFTTYQARKKGVMGHY